MSVQGIVLIDIAGLGLAILIINLVRTQRLYAGYALLWLIAVVGLIATISFPYLLGLVTHAVGAIFPASALSLLAFVLIFAVLISMSVQLSTLSARQVELIQMLALKELRVEKGRVEDQAPGDEPEGALLERSVGDGSTSVLPAQYSERPRP